MKEQQNPTSVLNEVLVAIVVSGLIYLGAHAYFVLSLRRIGVFDDGFVMANRDEARLRWSLEQGANLQSDMKYLLIALGLVVTSCVAAILFQVFQSTENKQETFGVWLVVSLACGAMVLMLMWATYLVSIAHSRFTTLDMVNDRALYDSWIMFFVLLMPLIMFAAFAWAKDVGVLLPSMGLWLILGFAGYWYWHSSFPGA